MLLLNYISVISIQKNRNASIMKHLQLKKYELFYKKVLTQRGSRSYTIYRLNVAHVKYCKTYIFQRKGDGLVLHFYEVKDKKKNGEEYTKGYRLTFGKNPIEKAGFTKDDELEVTYKKNKIIISKKKNEQKK